MAENYCISCGEVIPEGRQVCPKCEYEFSIMLDKPLPVRNPKRRFDDETNIKTRKKNKGSKNRRQR